MFGKKKEKESGRAPAAAPPPKPKPSPAPARKPTEGSTLSSHLEFEGKLTFSGTVTIDCKFKGNVVTKDRLVIGPAASVEAEINAGTVEIAGKVTGDVTATKNVKILKGGEVHGNIVTPSIAMEEGVVFEGQCSRPESARLAKQSAAPKTPSAPVSGFKTS